MFNKIKEMFDKHPELFTKSGQKLKFRVTDIVVLKFTRNEGESTE